MSPDEPTPAEASPVEVSRETSTGPTRPPTPPGLDAKEIPDDEIVIDIAPDLKVPPTPRGGKTATPAPSIPDRDHSLIPLLDIAIDQSVVYCEKEGLPKPNTSLWENFSRPFMNRALWHYCPDDIPDSPALCLLLGSAGIGVMYIPIVMALMEKAGKEEEEKKKPPKKKPRPETPPPEPEPTPANVKTWTVEEPEEPEEPEIHLPADILARMTENMKENEPTPIGL